MCENISKKVTLQDVAAVAGVSVSTVHRALQKKDGISASASQKIHQIAETLGYQTIQSRSPAYTLGAAAASLNSHTIGLLLVDTPLHLLHHRINVQLMSYLESFLARQGLLLTLHHASNASGLPPVVSADRLDGVIVMGELTAPEMISTLQQMNTVGVFLHRNACPHWDWVAPDYDVRGRTAANYLAQRGHERIGYLNYLPEHYGFENVGRAFVSQAHSIGLQAEEYSLDREEAKTLTQQQTVEIILDRILSLAPENRPTGLHIANDLIAHDLYNCLCQSGLRPMEDMDIIACDNDDLLLSRLFPKPATFDLNLEFIAKKLVESLLFNMHHPKHPRSVSARIFVPSRLIPATDTQIDSAFETTQQYA